MESTSWRTGTHLGTHLRNHPNRYEFAQAVRLLCLMARSRVKPESGINLDVLDEIIRFDSHVGDEFTPSEIVSINKKRLNKLDMTISFFGLFGQHAPLPNPYQKWVRENENRNDHALKAFLDIFNHRLISYLYLVLSKTHLSLASNVPERSSQAKYLNSLIGICALGTVYKKRLPLPGRSLQSFSGLLSDRRISLPRIKNILEAYLDTNVYIEQFSGGWMALDSHQQTHLSSSSIESKSHENTGGMGKRLGDDAVLGRHVWNQSMGISIFIGPMTWKEFRSFLPNAKNHAPLESLLMFLTEKRWRIDVGLLIKESEISKLRLSSNKKDSDRKSELGWTSWLSSGAEVSSSVHKLREKRVPERIKQAIQEHYSCTAIAFYPEGLREVCHG